MQLQNENTIRKIDSLGRITLPKGLRNRLNFEDNDEIEIYTMEHMGKSFVCLTKYEEVESKYFIARQVLEELGVSVPEELEAQF
jgi:AbrB family looped-hinge helix DNA binding protein